MNHARTRRLTAGAVAMTLLAGVLTLLVMQPAQANHGTRTLQASPETGSVAAGAAHTVKATLSEAATEETGSIQVDAEIWNGPADTDGPTPETPDRSCTVAVGASTCQFTVVSGVADSSEVRLWIDHDNRNELGQGGNTELDRSERRLADGTPDFDPSEGSEQPPEADCRNPEDFSTTQMPPIGNANGCGADIPPADAFPGRVAEPDLSDVIELSWSAPESIDCDAVATGGDRVTESDSVEGDTANVTIRCVYRGDDIAGIRIDGANVSSSDSSDMSGGGANDPEGEDGLDYDDACTSTSERTCELVVEPSSGQTGVAILCFWLDQDDDAVFNETPGGGNDPDGRGCADERVDDPENDDRTDRVLVRWGAAPVATSLDLTPESGSATAGSFRSLLATVADQYGDPISTDTPVNLEFVAGSPGDNGDDSTPDSVDRACTTSGGRCGIAYEVQRAGVDVICGWVGATPTLTGTSPGGNCGGETAGGDGVSARIDVVTWSWTTPTATSGGGGSAESVSSTQGYTLVGADGGIFNFGTSQFHGSMGDKKLNEPVIGLANKRGGTGYWEVARDGGIFTFGDAEFFGSLGGVKLNAPVLGMEATPSGKGYWLFAADGGIFTFGDAQFHGSMGDKKLNAPAVGLSVNDKGDGYWIVAQDGGIFSFGNVPFHGSTGDMKLNQPVFDMAPTAGDKGYWLVARDGGIFSFGDAQAKFAGSAVGVASGTVIGMGATPTTNGYWVADSVGGVYPFGDARALGDRRGQAANATYVGFATVPRA